MRILLIILAITFNYVLKAQEIPEEFQYLCVDPQSNIVTKSASSSGCQTRPYISTIEKNRYLPKSTSDVVKVNVNLIFIQKSDGSGNFQENNSDHTQLWDYIENTMNSMQAAEVITTNSGYFGRTVPVISVKGCHFERCYNSTKI